MVIRMRFLSILSIIFLILLLNGCSAHPAQSPVTRDTYTAPSGIGTRDNSIVCLTPQAPGLISYGNDDVQIDCSNLSDGYFGVIYTGVASRIKIQVTCPNTITYTYNLSSADGYEFFPLTSGNGLYRISVFESIKDSQYSTLFMQEIDVSIIDSLMPFLYANQYVKFHESDSAIQFAATLAESADSDLEVIEYIYNYVVAFTDYDYEKAKNVKSGYLPDIEATFKDQKGICLDFASLMAAMLRSQRIPTHLEVGYAGDVYHAWISTYIDEIGWVNGIIQFDGSSWQLMDPTFASSGNEKELQKYVGSGSFYETKFIY